MTTKEFLLNLPQKINPALLEGMNTVFHFDLEGEGGGQVTVNLNLGHMTVEEGLVGEANCKITATEENFKKVLKGELNPMMAILTGKMKITNQMEMVKFAKLLGWM
ncbi:MAG: SCP2 sterol-binding domain-containing protein [Saprospiraceae bacterium]|nr:SCP2 sterol-binding domain-containing protein [Saprospiraceae bacterium]HMW38096.1 SCP2 sterol-binding domain-containing protein [Saprospiraceae bacterium]HMX87137.1 SCP2 sterol-binding domain-containing protein [Saprospiraceae bacterium]HMZ38783.1 SCP2 sterol-binding domain-containing protein [Saprospiraceae bacterium]HNA63196.1 SCP2 sterol-binding domain-containing protein [Saprospiraceae bacterium]